MVDVGDLMNLGFISSQLTISFSVCCKAFELGESIDAVSGTN
jgi:hypothetical protein